MRTLVFHASGLTANRLRLRRKRGSGPWIAGAILLLGMSLISSQFPQRRLAFPVLAVLDAPVNFGAVAVGGESIRLFKIRNDGGADLVIGNVLVIGAAPPGLQVLKTCAGEVLHSQGECVVQVSFKPQDSRALRAELQVTDKSGEREMRMLATSEVPGRATPPDVPRPVIPTEPTAGTSTPAGVAPSSRAPRGADTGAGSGAVNNPVSSNGANTSTAPPAISRFGFDPESLTFSKIHAGESLTKSLVVINQGTATLHIRSIDVSGEHGGDFAYSDAACPKKDLVPNSRDCTISIVFQPSEPGQHDATIVVSDSKGMDYKVRLSGFALPPDMPIATLDPPTLELSGKAPIGTLRIRNTGGGTLQVGQPWLSGKNKNDFEVSGCEQTALQSGKEPCLVQVRYKPGFMAQGRGYSVAQLSFPNNTPTSPASATIVGRTEHTARTNPALEQLIGLAVGELSQQLGKPRPDAGNVKPIGTIGRPQTQYERPTPKDVIK